MKLRFQENPKEWRKSALLTALGLAIVVSLLRWRKVVSPSTQYTAYLVLAIVAVLAILKPRWFRGYYRLSLRLGFYSSQFLGRCVLAIFFIFVLTPLGLCLRLLGKDPLRLKRPQNAVTYWQPSKEATPLDRLF